MMTTEEMDVSEETMNELDENDEMEKKLMQKALLVLFEMFRIREISPPADFQGIDSLVDFLFTNDSAHHSVSIYDKENNEIRLVILFPFFRNFKAGDYSKDQKNKIKKILPADDVRLLIVAGPMKSYADRIASVVEKNLRELIVAKKQDYHEVFHLNFFLTYPFAYDCVQQNGMLFPPGANTAIPSHNIRRHKIYDKGGKTSPTYLHRPIYKNAVKVQINLDKWIYCGEQSFGVKSSSSMKTLTLNDSEIEECQFLELSYENKPVVFFKGAKADVTHLSIEGSLFTRLEEYTLNTIQEELHTEFLLLHIEGTDFAIENYIHSDLPFIVDEKERSDLQKRYPGFLEHKKAPIILESDPRMRFMGWKFSRQNKTVICVPSTETTKLQYRILKRNL